MQPYHTPALAQETISLLDIQPGGSYADLTFGGGGHSRLILSHMGPEGRLYGFDQDKDAQANIPEDDRFTFIESNFRFMRGQLRALGVDSLDGIIADLGVSSHHFDSENRGFSFRFDSPLDMRMNQRASFDATKLIATYPAEEITAILRNWGEVENPRRVAELIVRARDNGVVNTVGALTEAIAPCTPKKDANKFLSKVFQALRIEVNGEMEALKMALEQSLKILKPGGRLVVISYHSLEDRLVKNFFRYGHFDNTPQKDFFGRTQTPWNTVTRKAVVPTQREIEENPRSRSAKLRAAEKVENE